MILQGMDSGLLCCAPATPDGNISKDSEIPGNLFTEPIQTVLLRRILLNAVIDKAKEEGDERYQRLLPDLAILDEVISRRDEEVKELRESSHINSGETPETPGDQVVSVNPLILRGGLPHQ